MSTHEIREMISKTGHFVFADGHNDEGMIICRYNIPVAKLEYYLIPSDNISAYNKARLSYEPDAHVRLGKQIDIESISNARMIH